MARELQGRGYRELTIRNRGGLMDGHNNQRVERGQGGVDLRVGDGCRQGSEWRKCEHSRPACRMQMGAGAQCIVG
jgi:hypothetical protein